MVGSGTLTFARYNKDGIDDRYKIYDKLFCQFASPGVSSAVGNHLYDFVNCPDQRLRETFNNEDAKNR
eukprot:8950852-Prorocentrum_lima.AAC.1